MCQKQNNRRISSILRDNFIHEIYNSELEKLGEAGAFVSRDYLYGKVKERTGLSIRTISYIINHTKPVDL